MHFLALSQKTVLGSSGTFPALTQEWFLLVANDTRDHDPGAWYVHCSWGRTKKCGFFK